MGKRYEAAEAAFDRQKNYPLEEALRIVKSNATPSLTRRSKSIFAWALIRATANSRCGPRLCLPNGTGKTVRILAFVDENDADAALAAGADIIGTDEVINKIRNDGWLEFDATIATPPMMRKVGQIARILGPRGLMPNPKAGTVVPADDLPRVINELKAGRVEFRNDKTGNVHVPVGKASFSHEQLQENLKAVVDMIRSSKPDSQKGSFVRRTVLTSTMGPGVRVEGIM